MITPTVLYLNSLYDLRMPGQSQGVGALVAAALVAGCTGAVRLEVGPFATSDARVGAMVRVSVAGGKRSVRPKVAADQIVVTRQRHPPGQPLVVASLAGGGGFDVDGDDGERGFASIAAQAQIDVARIRTERMWTLGLGVHALQSIRGRAADGDLHRQRGWGPSLGIGRYAVSGSKEAWSATGIRIDCAYLGFGISAGDPRWLRCDVALSWWLARPIGADDALMTPPGL